MPTDAVILMPLFNDWDSASVLLGDLDSAFAGHRARVLIVDDCSTMPAPPSFHTTNLHPIEILRLRRNLGHQRAIAVGLIHIHQNIDCRAIVLMDADGQDRAADARRLFNEWQNAGTSQVVFAERAKRLENWIFRSLYHLYRWLHLVLTGDAVRVGNFSVVPASKLTQLAVMPELWNHYAAAVIRSRIGMRTVLIPRGARLRGHTQMNYSSLMLHGLSAFFVYGDIIGARLLAAVGVLLSLATAVIASAIAWAISTGHALPPWAAVAAGVAIIVLLQAILGALVLVFTVIGSRVNLNFLPIRDCPYFVESLRPLATTSE
ncbi:MAG: glycosyltransferase [Acidobacteria bacterium]|nr:glycosyltransferase [Acidobacteriota bacterium]